MRRPIALLGILLTAGVCAAAPETAALKKLAPKGLRIGAAINQTQSDGGDAKANRDRPGASSTR